MLVHREAIMAFKPNPDVVSEVIVFNGYRYRRYPNSSNPAHRKYFARAKHRLHRDVWEFHNGVVPDGHDIHHIDGNTLNNDISNLQCIDEKAHYAEHREELRSRNTSPRQLAHLAKIRHMTKAWHASEEGRAWHKQNAINNNFGKKTKIDVQDI